MNRRFKIGATEVGDDQETYVIAEIGINHNGDLKIAKQLMKVAAAAGCQAVKFQKRTPAICVPEDQKNQIRETPWGMITYLEYKEKTELSKSDYEEIDRFASEIGIDWFASPWDIPSLEFLVNFEPKCIKIASASLTDHDLLKRVNQIDAPVIISTGMSTMFEIEHAVSILTKPDLAIAHATSTYPCPPNELNLRMIPVLRDKFKVQIGYSGHETGLATTIAAVALGATFIERHITLDRSMWGTDHAASVEPNGLERLVRDIRNVKISLGDGKKRVYDSELSVRAKLRRN